MLSRTCLPSETSFPAYDLRRGVKTGREGHLMGSCLYSPAYPSVWVDEFWLLLYEKLVVIHYKSKRSSGRASVEISIERAGTRTRAKHFGDDDGCSSAYRCWSVFLASLHWFLSVWLDAKGLAVVPLTRYGNQAGRVAQTLGTLSKPRRQQQREMIKFWVFWSTWTRAAYFLYLHL